MAQEQGATYTTVSTRAADDLVMQGWIQGINSNGTDVGLL